MASDPFVALWKLDPARSDYEFGTPPQSGLYRIEPDGEGYLVTMTWVDALGKDFQQSYHAVPDGMEHPYENLAVSMTRIDERTLDSAVFKDGSQVAYARRVLSADGQTMTVTQSGTTPQGVHFSNLSVYVRQA